MPTMRIQIKRVFLNEQYRNATNTKMGGLVTIIKLGFYKIASMS